MRLKVMMRTEKLPRVCVGVDLHKLQFTVCAVNEETGEMVLSGVFKTEDECYKDFCKKLHTIEAEQECLIELAVEATGNARYFKNRKETEGFGVLIVNTSKFKVITTSAKKTDANDAAALAFYLSKDMLPESHLCDQTSEEIRRMLKTRSILVSSTVKIKNQIHGMLLGYGIETKAAQFQSKKKRQQLISSLAGHTFSKFTASSLEVTLNILDDIYAQVKMIEEEIKKMTEENEDVELLKTVPETAFVQVAMGIIRQPQNTAEWKLMKQAMYCVFR